MSYKAQFADAKKKLIEVTSEEWDELPAAQDLVKGGVNNKRRKVDNYRFTPVPDSVLEHSANSVDGA